MTSWISRSRLSVVGRLLLVGGIAMILLLGFNAAQLSVHGPTHVYAAAGDTRSHTFTTSTNLLQPSGYTGSGLTAWLNKTHPGSRLAAYGGSFATAESKTGISAQGLLALAIVQTGWGASISGNDVYAISGHSYSSIGTGIVDGAVWIKQNYLTSGGPYYAGATLAGMGKHYATSGSWPGLVASVAQEMYSPDPAAALTPVSPKVSSPAPAPVTHSPAPVTQSPAPVTQSPAPVTQSPAPVTQSPAPVTQSPAPVTHSPAPVTQSPAPVTQSPAPAANPPATQPPADPNAGNSGNSNTPPDNSGTPPDNSGTPPDNSGGSSGDGSTDPGAWTPPPTPVPAPAPQQTCIPLLQPALALGLQPCIPLGQSNSHGPAGAKAPKSNGKNQSSAGDGQSGAPQSSSQDSSSSTSDGNTGSGSAGAGSTGSGSAGSATSSSGSAGSTGSGSAGSTGSGSSGTTGSGSGGGTTGSSPSSGGNTGSGGAAGAPAGGVAPTPASQASSSPQAAAVKEVSLVASSGDGLAWPAVLGGLALFLGLALLVLGRRSPSRAKPPRR